MSYLSIENLYKEQDILLFKECYATEKVHGTSAHISWKEGNLRFFSGAANHNKFVELFSENLKDKFNEFIGPGAHAVIYGEAYGGKLLGMSKTYGKDLKFVVFDINIDGLWLAVPQAHTLTENLGLEFVHYIKIPTTMEAIKEQCLADSVQAVRNGMGPGIIREGVVLRPLIEVRKNNDKRIISKHKRDEFRETQTVRNLEIDPEKLKLHLEAEEIADEWVTEMRLIHVLDKLPGECSMTRTKEVIDAMIKDVYKEGKGEFVESKEVEKVIANRTAKLFKEWVKKNDSR